MSKDQNRYEFWADTSWFDEIEAKAHKSASWQQMSHQATQVPPTTFQKLLGALKRLLRAST